jgi:hypothetical protein
MSSYELQPSNDGYLIPSGMEALARACDKWLRARELRDGHRSFVFGRMGRELPPRPQSPPKPKMTDEQRLQAARESAKRYRERNRKKRTVVEKTAEEKAEYRNLRNAQTARWRERNREKYLETARTGAQKRLAAMTEEERITFKARQAEKRRERYQRTGH